METKNKNQMELILSLQTAINLEREAALRKLKRDAEKDEIIKQLRAELVIEKEKSARLFRKIIPKG